MKRNFGAVIPLAMMFIALSLIALSAPAGAQQSPATIFQPGYVMPVWSEDFDEGAGVGVSPENWTYDIGNGYNGWGNNELEYYTNSLSNVYDDGDALNIVDLNQPNYEGTGLNWTSGKVLSVPSWTYGQFQIRAQLPTGDGVWPAIWMMPALNGVEAAGPYGNGSWPDNGEIDIMEEVGWNPNNVQFTLHYNLDVGGNTAGMVSVPTATTAYHVYGLDWAPDHITGLVDGNPVFTYVRNGQGWQGWPFDQPFHMIMNDAIGGNWGGQDGVSPSISGQDFMIDYVHVEKKMSTPFTGSPAPVPGIIEAANYDLGGEGYAYHSNTTANQGGEYRNDGIGIGGSGDPNNPYSIGWITPDEWLNYTVNVAKDATYAMAFRVATIYSGESFNVEVDDNTVGTVTVPNTGGWVTWQTVTLPNIPLTSGQHVIRLLANQGAWNINYFQVAYQAAVTVGANPNPATIGHTVTLRSTVTPPLGMPGATGSITFFDGANPLGTVPLVKGSAILPVTGLPVGQHTIVAGYSGDPSYAASPSLPFLLVVNDAPPPTTAASLSGPLGKQGWYTGSVQVTLTAKDGAGPANIAGTYYILDGGSQQTYSSPVDVPGDGIHTMTYWSVDKEGVVGPAKSVTIKIDGTPPTTTAQVEGTPVDGDYPVPVTIVLSPTDATSGVMTTYRTVNGGAPLAGKSFMLRTPGNYTITYWSVDKAGNVEPAHSLAVTAVKAGTVSAT